MKTLRRWLRVSGLVVGLALAGAPGCQTWVPGVGITTWSWAHHGTLSQADLTLVEVRR